ncbi:hypothetical protein HOLleu_03169 [Holothuria leucospilota]|uniref:Uncharacterized protein n=1 Tax=Holothuria leucospilota TaxID=206669 RepID=A0A9Q1HK44_HOLLE|nr:hypothetical protein HOLleu_03169 [Holothuria leucospilota]
MPARIKAVAQVRNWLREKVELKSIRWIQNSIKMDLFNVENGKVACHPSVNVSNAVTLGNNEMEAFEKSCPLCFYETIMGSILTVAVTRNHLKVGEVKVFDAETIYVRDMGLQSGPRRYRQYNGS